MPTKLLKTKYFEGENMSIRKDHVFLLSTIVELKTQYEMFFKVAEQFGQENPKSLVFDH